MQYLQYKLFHNMNLEYYKYDNKFEENETNIIFNKITNNFIEKYKDYFNKDFILYYTDDILGLISYYLLSTISQVSEFTFKIYCKTKIKKTSKYINKKHIIKKLKIKDSRNVIYLSTFNPLYYVINETKDYNFLNSNNSIIANLTPKQLKNISEYYNIKDEKLLSIFNNNSVNNFINFCNGEEGKLTELYNSIGYLYENKNPKILVYNLSGDESDFSIFDEIRENSKNSIIFYNYSDELHDVIQYNLNPFIEARNAPRIGFNVNIPSEIIDKLKSQREIILEVNSNYAESLKKMKIGG